VPLSPRVEHLWVDSTSVITNPYSQVSVRVFKFKIDTLRSGMTKGVNQSLSTDAINLLLNC
jgi:hypothetical protein